LKGKNALPVLKFRLSPIPKAGFLFIHKDNRLNKGEYARKNGYRNKKY
jgi:hypothetical protein